MTGARADARRARILWLLSDQPDVVCAMLSDAHDVPGHVVLTFGLRMSTGEYVYDMILPADRYDDALMVSAVTEYCKSIQ